MSCKTCHKPHTGGAMYMDGECAYCKHKTKTWDMNGQVFSCEDDILSAQMSQRYFEGMQHGVELAILHLYWFMIGKRERWYKAKEYVEGNLIYKDIERLFKFLFDRYSDKGICINKKERLKIRRYFKQNLKRK